MAVTAESTSVWNGLVSAAPDNPTLVLLGLIVGAFASGFAVRGFLRERSLREALARAEASEKELTTQRLEAEQQAEKAADAKSRTERVAASISPAQLRESLAELLDPWSRQKQEVVIAGIVRQLLARSGHAILTAPEKSVRLKWDADHEKFKLVVETMIQDDPAQELRDAVVDPEQLSEALWGLSAYGMASVRVAAGKHRMIRISTVQGPGNRWTTKKDKFERRMQQ